MTPNLDLATLRTLVLAADLGGYARAGARLGLTPSAVSLQMKRLQVDVGVPLFRKAGRGVSLTEIGEVVLRHARRVLAANDELLDTVRGAALGGTVRLGCAQDFAEPVLPGVLARLAELYPLLTVEVRIEGNADLADAIERGELDLALTVGQADRSAAERVGALQLVWIAGGQFAPRDGQPVPLVLLGPRCGFRKLALAALDGAGRSWRIAAVSPSLAGLWASALGGLGVTVRSAAGLPPGLVHGETLFGLPPLGTLPVALHLRPQPEPALVRVRQFVLDALAEAGTA